jgi:hypothetical protein
MTDVIYPVPYSIIAQVGRKSKFERYEISDEMRVTIPAIEADAAPIVVSLDKVWPLRGLQGQPPERWNRADDLQACIAANPTVKLRHHEGRFYAQMMIFGKENYIGDPRWAKPSDLSDIGDHRVVWANGFQRPYDHHTVRSNIWESNTELHMHHRQGDLMWTGDKKIKALEPGQENRRSEAFEKAAGDVLAYIEIDGNLWRAIDGEPVFKYRIQNGAIEIEITDDHYLSSSVEQGVFRLDRHQDCLDHIREITAALRYPEWPIMEGFDNLQISPSCDLTFDDEAATLLAMAHATILKMERFIRGAGLQQTPAEMQKVYKKLFDLMGPGYEGRVDEIGETLESSRGVWPHENYEVAGIGLALNRWSMRPVAESDAFKI